MHGHLETTGCIYAETRRTMYMDKVVDLCSVLVGLVQDGFLATDRPRSTAYAEGEVKCTEVSVGFLEEVPTSYIPFVEDKLDLDT
jgi:hypothetical protein